LGLVLFAAGSLMGALSESIYGIILARILQGTGAIGSVLIALLADLTSDEQRTKAMAVIGMTIGISFSLAMVISPALTHQYGLSGIFYLTAVLALIALILLHLVIPSPHNERFHADSETDPYLFRSVLRNRQLLSLNLGIFCQHFILTATFFVIPMILSQEVLKGTLGVQWHFYLPLMIFSFICMLPFIILAEKKKQMKLVFIMAVSVTMISQLALIFAYSNWFSLCCCMFVYFIVFNILEASLPSLVSKQANPRTKGTAMGVYSTSQFLGIFFGGALAGILYQFAHVQGIFLANTLISLVWLFTACFMKIKVSLETLTVSYQFLNKNTQFLVSKLLETSGVEEVILLQDEQLIHLRINPKEYQTGQIEKCLEKININ
jgi:MFS family permease